MGVVSGPGNFSCEVGNYLQVLSFGILTCCELVYLHLIKKNTRSL